MPLIMGILAQGAAAPAAAGAYDLLETQTLAGTAASVTFTGLDTLAAGYQHLQLRVVARTTQVGDGSTGYWRFNGDDGANYAYHDLRANGSSVASVAQSGITVTVLNRWAASGATANAFSVGVIDILDFGSTTKNTTMRALTGHEVAGDRQVNLFSNLWNSTAAVTSFEFYPSSADWEVGSRFSLYGIKGA